MLRLWVLAVAAAVTAAASSQVEVDNTWVRALRVKQRPHEKSEMRDFPASAVVYLTDVRQRFTGADGKLTEVTRKAGDVAFYETSKRLEENLLDQPTEAIVIELKPNSPKSPPIALDPVKLDPEHHPVPFENDRVRMLRTILEPHLKAPLHEHPHYVVVYLTELHTTMIMGDGRVVDNPRRPGEVDWRDALKHATENIGEHTAVEIQVEIK